MAYLLDTHFVLWALADSSELTSKERALLVGPEHQIVVSAASIWEIEIKRELKKLKAPLNLLEAISQVGFDFLNMSPAHAILAGRLPAHHRDPFDRMLIAQAKIENFKILTRDSVFKKYDT